MEVKGSIVEGGVHDGDGLMAWAKLSAALEPYAIHRKVIGFDTFAGFPAIGEKDESAFGNTQRRAGGFAPESRGYEEIHELVQEFDANRPLKEIEKVILVKGDAVETIPAYVRENPHLLVSLLFLDFDLYAPTRTALECLVPRMCRGAVLAFDEINSARWPGETLALLEMVDIKKHRINRFTMDPNIAYIVL
jgi:hypothetical protein